MAVAQRSGADPSATSDILLKFFSFGPTGNQHSEKDYTLAGANLAPRAQDPNDASFYGSDFLDVTVGDLDRRRTPTSSTPSTAGCSSTTASRGRTVPRRSR